MSESKNLSGFGLLTSDGCSALFNPLNLKVIFTLRIWAFLVKS